MKSSEILREAARLVEREGHGFGCIAIASVLELYGPMKNGVYDIPKKVMAAYRKVAPRGQNLSDPWWITTGKHGQGPSIIGLCLAAAIAESEGD